MCSQALQFLLFEVGFKVSSGTALWYRSSDGTDLDNSELVRPVCVASFRYVEVKSLRWRRGKHSGFPCAWFKGIVVFRCLVLSGCCSGGGGFSSDVV